MNRACHQARRSFGGAFAMGGYACFWGGRKGGQPRTLIFENQKSVFVHTMVSGLLIGGVYMFLGARRVCETEDGHFWESKIKKQGDHGCITMSISLIWW